MGNKIHLLDSQFCFWKTEIEERKTATQEGAKFEQGPWEQPQFAEKFQKKH